MLLFFIAEAMVREPNASENAAVLLNSQENEMASFSQHNKRHSNIFEHRRTPSIQVLSTRSSMIESNNIELSNMQLKAVKGKNNSS